MTETTDYLRVLERGHTMEVLIHVANHPGCTKKDVILIHGDIGSRTRFVRIQELLDIGLLMEGKENDRLYLSFIGQKVTEHLIEIANILKFPFSLIIEPSTEVKT